MRLLSKYTYQVRYGWEYHSYIAVGGQGAVSLNISGRHGSKDYSAGLELHSRQPRSDKHEPPTFENCDVLNGPCWHDGTSLYAMEVLLPMWKTSRYDHDLILEFLATEYVKHFVDEGGRDE